MCCVEEDKYKYQWSLDSHPDGDETGQMTDIDSSSLKLSKVAELYVMFYFVKALLLRSELLFCRILCPLFLCNAACIIHSIHFAVTVGWNALISTFRECAVLHSPLVCCGISCLLSAF